MPVLKAKIDGVWKEVVGGAAAPVESDRFVVEIDVDTMTSSHTPSEIKAAHDAGKYVIAHYLAYDYTYSHELVGRVCFIHNIDGANKALYVNIDGSVEVETFEPSIDKIVDAEPGQIAVIKTVDGMGAPTTWEAVNLPVTVDENGYTDITGMRQPTAVSMVRSGSVITLTTALQGGVQSVSTITLDENDYPISIVTDGDECVLSWEGFEDA